MIAALAAFVLAAAPPPAPGPWHQLGAALTSKPDKQVHFFRTALNPTALGIVARSSSAKPIRVHWWSYCEFESDDEMTGENQATVSGAHTVAVYPPVLSGATLCYVSVVARVPDGKAAAAIFSY